MMDDGVTEVDLAAEVVRDLTFFQNLEQEVHDIRVSLLDFVQTTRGSKGRRRTCSLS